MSVKHATQEPQQAAEWGQGINNSGSSRKTKKPVDPNSELAKLAAKKYKDERLKVRKALTMAVSQAHKDELAEFESQVFDSDLPTGFFSQFAQLEPVNYGAVAMLQPSSADCVECDVIIDLEKLEQYPLELLRDRNHYLADLPSLDADQERELDALYSFLAPRLEASNPDVA